MVEGAPHTAKISYINCVFRGAPLPPYIKEQGGRPAALGACQGGGGVLLLVGVGLPFPSPTRKEGGEGKKGRGRGKGGCAPLS